MYRESGKGMSRKNWRESYLGLQRNEKMDKLEMDKLKGNQEIPDNVTGAEYRDNMDQDTPVKQAPQDMSKSRNHVGMLQRERNPHHQHQEIEWVSKGNKVQNYCKNIQ